MNVPDWIPCTILTLEAVRLGSVIVTVVHLLALAINHYIGIMRPLHYAAIMTKRTVSVCIIAMWISPNILIFTYFSCNENQGFQASTFVVRCCLFSIIEIFLFFPVGCKY